MPTLRELAALGPGVEDGAGGPEPTDYLLFALAAVRRWKWLTGGLLVVLLAMLGAVFMLKTPVYRAETRILAQRQQALPSIARSNVSDDQPTRAAWELIHRRDNLLDLLKVAGLLDAPAGPARTGWLQGAVARVRGVFSAADDDPVEALVVLLDKRLKVEAGEVTINIELEWTDPQQAYRIVDRALQNFLEARHVQEVTTLDDTITLLRGRAAALRAELDRAIEESRRAVLQDALRPTHAQISPVVATPQQGHTSEELVRLKSMLDAKERAIGDVEEFRRRRLSELLAQYDSRRSVYAEAHPEMVNLRQEIAALTRDSPQVTALRAEERRLRDEYQARVARDRAPRAGTPPVSEVAPHPVGETIDAAVEQSDRVREARSRYQEIVESVNRAQLDLDTARSAFKHRYKIIWPVQVPKKPVSPNPLKIFGIGGIVALALALLVPVILDWRSGLVLQRWQVERGLGIPVLVETNRAS